MTHPFITHNGGPCPVSIKTMGKRVWVTREGQRMRWSEMTDSHLLNTASMIERNTSRNINSALRAYGMVQGEAAEMAMESALSQLQDEEPEAMELAAEMRAYVAYRLHQPDEGEAS